MLNGVERNGCSLAENPINRTCDLRAYGVRHKKPILTFNNTKPLQRGRNNPGALALNLMLFGLFQLPPEATSTVTRPALRA